MTILGNKIAALVIETPAKIGKIFIPEEARRLTQEAIVKLVGTEVRHEDIKVGARVLWDPYEQSTRIDVDGENLILLNVDKLLGVVL